MKAAEGEAGSRVKMTFDLSLHYEKIGGAKVDITGRPMVYSPIVAMTIYQRCG